MAESLPALEARTALVVGAGGGIGSALVDALAAQAGVGRVIAVSRRPLERAAPKVRAEVLDPVDESAVAALAGRHGESGELDLVVIATGMLHAGELMPEKRLADIDPDRLRQVLDVNTVLPAILAKHLLPALSRDTRSVFAALSARVGSIDDNRLGGWYAYRCSKAALNMLIRTAAIELGRTHPSAVCIGLHPGTVDTALSRPFRQRVPEGRLFSPAFAADALLAVIAACDSSQSGRCFAWDGSEVPP